MATAPKKEPITRFEVRRSDGEIVAIHERIDLPSGDKRMYWRRPDGSSGLNGMPLADLPLYGSERLAGWESAPWILLTEGEKAAQRLIEAGYPALGTVTGASSTPSAAALEVLRGHDVVLWPDNDRVGAEHMERVAEALKGVAASVRTLTWTSAPEHGDAADYLAASFVDVTIEELVDGAHAVAEALRPGATGMDAADLLALDLPPLRWVVPELLPEGTTVLAAPPKVGKSCLIYQMAVEIAIGGELLGRRVEPGSVLYLALEDGQRRGQDRLRTALAGRTMPRGRLEVRWSAPMIGQGLEEELTAWLDTHSDAALVAIDTLQRVRAGGDGRRNAYEVDVADLGRLQSIFRDRSAALAIVHHAAKAKHDDFLASVSGTYGITGSADTTMVIKRKRLEQYGSITVTGRDIAEVEVPVSFDEKLWRLAPRVLSESRFERSEVYEIIRQHGPIWPKAIGEIVGKSRQAAAYLVDQLVADGAVVRVAKGYAIAAPEHEEESLARARVMSPLSPLDGREGDHGAESKESKAGHPPARAREDTVEDRYQASFEELR